MKFVKRYRIIIESVVKSSLWVMIDNTQEVVVSRLIKLTLRRPALFANANWLALKNFGGLYHE